MDKKILVSIAIPTWNRALYLENLLNNILPQAEKSKEPVEVCISNNGSTDNTREVVMKFKEKYPDLIKYNEFKKNLGADVNIFKVMEMSEGEFIWTFGDDDNIIKNGLNEVVNFLKKIPKENTGLIVLKTEAYFFDRQTGGKIVYYSGLNKNQPETYEIDKKDIIGLFFPDIIFISGLLFNNKIVKEIFKEEKDTMEKAIGIGNIHILLFSLMFLRCPHIKGIAFNKIIICQELPRFKFFVEDRFKANYKMARKLWRLMKSIRYMDDYYISIFVEKDKNLRWAFITDMLVLRAFKSFNCFSYFGCLKLFFRYAPFIDALLFSLVFSTLFLVPSVLLRFMYKILLVIRHGKKWRTQWQLITNITFRLSGGTMRQVGWGEGTIGRENEYINK